MKNEPQYRFLFDGAAARGEIPADMNIIDAGACVKLSQIYEEYKSAQDKTEAKAAGHEKKAALWSQWNSLKVFYERINDHIRILTRIEEQATKLRKQLQNGLIPDRKDVAKLLDALDNIQRVED